MTIEEIRKALITIHHYAMGKSPYMSVPADPNRDADLILSAAIDELATARTTNATLQAEIEAAKAGELAMRREASAGLDAAEFAVSVGKGLKEQRDQTARDLASARAEVKRRGALIKDAETKGFNSAVCPWCSGNQLRSNAPGRQPHGETCPAFTPGGALRTGALGSDS